MGTLSQSLFIPLIGHLKELYGISIAVIIHSFDRSLDPFRRGSTERLANAIESPVP